MARCSGNGRGDALLSMGACYDGKDSGVGGATLSICPRCKGKGHVGGGAGLSRAHCNGNGGGCAALLMACCNGNSRGDTTLLTGTCYNGKGSGGGVHGMLQRRMTTHRMIAFLLAGNRQTNDNQPAMGVDE
jgi:hypothetical protein